MEDNFNIYTEITPQVPKLYHYTSQAGLLGIVNHKQLWFTNIHYMNDSTEYSYSLQVIMDVIKDLYGFGEDEKFLELFPNNEDIEPIFTFSLSENGDLLSQWRGYCPNGGYSISFFNNQNFWQMSQMIKTNNLFIGECLYDKYRIEEFVKKKVVELVPEEFKARKEEEEKHGRLKGWLLKLYDKIIKNTLKYAPLIKHPAFQEEKEWRIVANYAEHKNTLRIRLYKQDNIANTLSVVQSLPFDDLFDKLVFRQGKSFLIPYLEIPLIETKEPFIITKEEAKAQISIIEVIVGPTPHKELSVRACELLLLKSNILLVQNNLSDKSTVVTPSMLPYRNW